MDALALLRLYVEWGVDEALEDAPLDRRRAPAPEPPPQAGDRSAQPHAAPAGPASGRGSPAAGAAPPPTNTQRAMEAAGEAQSLDRLRAALAAFDGCTLRDTAANLVFAAGDPTRGLVLIGDPPGEAEDRAGLPFAGPDGALLDRMLASIGLNREALLCTPLIPWRPPGGRVPSPGDIAVCLPFLHRVIVLAAPRRVVIAGPTAARHLLASTRRRGAQGWNDMTVPGLANPVPAVVMPSPRMVAQTASARREAWAALRLLRRGLDADAAPP